MKHVLVQVQATTAASGRLGEAFSAAVRLWKRERGSFVQVLQLFVPLWAPFTHENGANY